MKYCKYLVIVVLGLLVNLNFTSCLCSRGSSSDIESDEVDQIEEDDDEIVASDNFNKMMKQIDKAIAKGNYGLAFDVLNSIPAHFDDYGRFYYNPKNGEMGDYDSRKGREIKYTSAQYCRKAVSLLKSESDILLSKNDPDMESIYLDHLADFDLGVNKVNIGKFYKVNKESKDNERYQEAVTIYNDYLISVIRKACVKGKSDIAKKISLLVRDGLSFKPDSEHDYDYIWAYDTEAKDEAKEILKENNIR